MDGKKIEDLLDKIKSIEEKNDSLISHISNLSTLSRNELINEINQSIYRDQDFFSRLGVEKSLFVSNRGTTEDFLEEIIQITISNIQANPRKKPIHLNEFLNIFYEISDADKNVILNSLKGIESIEKLKRELISLTKNFKLKF